MQTRLKSFVLSPFVSQKLVTALARPNKEDLITMRELMATGQVKPVIDKCYSLSEVPEAIRYLAKGHAQGNIEKDHIVEGNLVKKDDELH